MRINLNFEYDKLHLKEITILIPKYHTNMVSFLTPVLGLYGINVKEFINDFEAKTKFINFDIVIPTTVRISKIKTFEILLKTPYVVSLLSNIQDFSISKPLGITILSIYKVSLIKSVFRLNFLKNLHKRIYKSLRKYLHLIIKSSSTLSLNNPVLNFFEKKNCLNILKSKISLLIQFKNISLQKYGAFLLFNNASSSVLDYLKTSCSLINLSFSKVSANFISSLAGRKFFSGNVFYISSSNWNYFFNFVKDIITKKFTSNLFPLYFRFNKNLFHTDFFKTFTLNFNAIKNSLNIYLLRIIYKNLISSAVISKFLGNKVIFLLNNRNANLSSNFM